jgi:glycosyltransferase involved in cell wall biosynthesis
MPKTNQKLNILLSCGSYSWGGLEMVALESTLKLLERGLAVKLLCSVDSMLCNKAMELGIETLPYFSNNRKIPLTIMKLKKYLKNTETDIIHSHHSHDLWVLTPALGTAGSSPKLFLTKHVASGVKKKDLFHKQLYNRVDGVFAVSGYIKKSVVNTTPVPENKVHVLPNGVNLSRFNRHKYNRNEILRSLSIPADRTIAGLVGRITPGKGHMELIEAAKLLNIKFPEKLIFVLVGSSGKGEELYEQNIRMLAAGIHNILFTGQTEEPQKLMSIMDILAFPSHDESFGRVVTEAMAMEIPVAASGYAGVLDIISDGITGMLFKPKDPQSLANALERLITDEPLRKQLAAAGRKLVEEKFTDDIITEKLIEFYQKQK